MRIGLIIAFKNFRDEEYFGPKKIFEDKGYEVITISNDNRGQATGKLGGTADVNILTTEVVVAGFDAICFIGGIGCNVFYNDTTAHKIAKEAVRQGKVLGAICSAPVILANAGLLEKKKATVFESDVVNILSKGAIYLGGKIQSDENIVTANGPYAAELFAKKIIEKLTAVSK